MNKKHILTLSMLAIVIFVLGAYAAKAEPVSIRIGSTEISFLPLVITSKAAEAPPGVLYVFSSTATTDGSAGGRNTIGDLCPTEDPGSHFCSLQEIENAWAISGVHFSDPFPQSWVDNPTLLGTFYPDSNGDPRTSMWTSIGEYGNCASWTNDIVGAKGIIIMGSAVSVFSVTCDTVLPIACCKQMP